MRRGTYEMFHDRFARDVEHRFEFFLAAGIAIVALYTLIYHVF
jgi:hypothetical protein